MTDLDIRPYIAPGRRAHLIGIGGVSMAPLAEVLHGAGMAITGSDMRESPAVEHATMAAPRAWAVAMADLVFSPK